MSAVLERTEEITIEELETEIRAYEAFYGLTTEELLALINSRDRDRLEEIEDAGFWRSSHELLCRLREAPEKPDVRDEDPNRALVLIYAGKSRDVRSASQSPCWFNQKQF